MTDSRTTEKLCKLLEERGIEWKDGDAACEIEWNTPDGRHCSAMYWKPTFTVLISGCTPEQAIAATLWSEREKALEELVLDMWHELNYTSVRAEDGCNKCLEKMAAFDERMKDLGLMEADE